MTQLVSPSEVAFLLQGVAHNLRSDGRSRTQLRPVVVETGLVSQANGSSRLRRGNTDVLVGVKLSVGVPDLAAPNTGRVEVAVECAPSASPLFEGRGAREVNAGLAAAAASYLAAPGALDLEALCIRPDTHCWVVHVDAVVLDSGGNVLDAVCAAARAALANTTLPRVSTVPSETPGEFDLEVSDDPDDVIALDVSRLPVSVTLARLGDFYVADPTLEEEACQTAAFTVGVTADGTLSGATLSGDGGIPPAMLIEMFQVARKLGMALVADMNDLGEQEAKLDRDVVGFLG
ncbi:exosome complex exonuclease RRP42 [Thecamonas trahens ATCC 50062]|uniref:Ribosomal RNA-processing protein 42 n=1 Tax=Thecamonas trahens ATCC 50062 TaxID=461836 RepID=A0A0L0DLY2_THETB|nr:exosome complex exonuclease RRP42 [Thecamonas trahens ATCC 50062]KNC52398.1 exosome complex exonuclease RRP42 [Thecamonas trahens ATCC 50062]|eukprot:XP_013755442.1 exosome complex exonuclease RRP42 [Thecamonas trahens ATCC 50062]